MPVVTGSTATRDPNSLFVLWCVPMRNRDLIYVSNAPFTEVQKVLTAFNGVTGPSPPRRLSAYAK